MSKNQETPKIPLPKGWKKQVRSAVLHGLSLAQYAVAYTRSWAKPIRLASLCRFPGARQATAGCGYR